MGLAAAVLIVGGGAYMLMRDPAPPSASEVTAQVQADKKVVEAFTCLDNFNYSTSPVNISPWDERTRSWMDVLVQAGLYSGPTKVVSGGWMAQEHLQYAQTDAGKKAVHGTKLCYADGIAVDSVKYDSQPGNTTPPRATGFAQYHLANPAAWISTPAAREALPDRFNGKSPMEFPVNFVLLDGKWQPLNDATREQLRTLSAHAAPQKSESGGLFSWLSNVFSGNPGGAVQGRWAARGGFLPMVFEFKPDSAVIMGSEVPAKYVRAGDTVEVQALSRPGDSMKLKVVSSDELRLLDGSSNGIRLIRVQ